MAVQNIEQENFNYETNDDEIVDTRSDISGDTKTADAQSNEYIAECYEDYYSDFLNSHYESFNEFIYDKIEEAQDDKDNEKVHFLYDILHFQEGKNKKEIKQTTETMDKVSLEDMTIEELVEVAIKNQGIISENDQVMKEALIKRIIGQQQQIDEQEKEIKRLRGQKVI